MENRHGFELISFKEIPEIGSRGRFFRHLLTGAELLSIENDDENKVFGITFRTPPYDSCGLPHILEHSVLCGSQKHPLKKPFVELLKGSLKTFLNAFTYPDKTTYPLASQNKKDFYNLVDIYLDAVFYPLLEEHTFAQEGWHYEMDAPAENLRYKGVVFNEMKGAYSSPDNILNRLTQHSLFPDTIYGYDSGGDPLQIPNLTYKKLKDFHADYYHPSNARIFFYGDDDPEERLHRINRVLEKFDRRVIDSSIELQSPFIEPKRVVDYYDPGEQQAALKSRMTVNWLLPEATDTQLALAFRILAHILVGTPASPLRKALIDSGLGEDLTGVGLENELQQMYFSTGLKGILPDNVDHVESLIQSTLAGLVKTGIDPNTIAASMHTVEFRLRENNTGAFPRGLSLMLHALTSWLYDADPFAPLAFEAPLNDLKERIVGEKYFETLIEEHLLENNHRTTVILHPKAGLKQREDQEEAERLARARDRMSGQDLAGIIEETHLLKMRQETPDSQDAIKTIPVLTLADLDKQVKSIPMDVLNLDGVQVFYHDLSTNGILYVDVGFDLSVLPQELLPFIRLFGRALTDMGTHRESFVQLTQRIGRTTGGIRQAIFTSTHNHNGQSVNRLFIRAKALVGHSTDLFAILREIFLDVNFADRERFQQIVLEEKSRIESAIIPYGHQYVDSRLRAMFTEADWVGETIGGLDYLFFLRDLLAQIDANWSGVFEKLSQVRKRLVNNRTMVYNVTVDAPNWRSIMPEFVGFTSAIPAHQVARQSWIREEGSPFEALTIPAKVNFVGKAINLFENGYKLHGSILAVNKYTRTSWLWDKVRVQGGAYGSFLTFDKRSGVLVLVSYRDPNLLATLNIYDRTGQFLSNLELSDDDVVKSIIGAVADLDAYQLPDAKGYTSLLRYLVGEDDQLRQELRDQLFAITVADFHNLGELLERISADGKVVVIGSAEAVAEAHKERGSWLDVKKVL